MTPLEALDELSDAYVNVLREYAEAEGKLLRLAPIGGGSFAGELQEKLHILTPQAVTAAWMSLEDEVMEKLLEKDKKVQICVWKVKEQNTYEPEFDMEFELNRNDAELAQTRLISLDK